MSKRDGHTLSVSKRRPARNPWFDAGRDAYKLTHMRPLDRLLVDELHLGQVVEQPRDRRLR